MTTHTPASTPRSRPLLGDLIAVGLVAWLLFFGGLTTLRTLLTPARLSQVAAVADTIKTGVGKVTSGGPAAPAANPAPAAAPRIGAGISAGAAPAANPPADTQAQIEAAANAAYQATAQASIAVAPIVVPPVAPQAAPNPADPATWPTAAIPIPTVAPVEQVRVIPIAAPPVYANSAPIGPTPIPTMTYPTPLPPAQLDGYTLSADGMCLTVERAGKRYQDCEQHAFTLGEARTIADLMRTGVIPGVPVQ